MKLEKILHEALDLARLSDAVRMLDEGNAIKVPVTPAVLPKKEGESAKPIEPVTEGDLSEVDPATIEV